MNTNIYLTIEHYSDSGGVLHVKAYGRDIAEYHVPREALIDLADNIRRNDIMLKTR